MTDLYREVNGHKMEKMDDTLLLKAILSELQPQLPIQNPIPFFVHNNPLQYWEKYHFEEGITKSCVLYERAGIQLDRAFVREFEDIVIPVLSSYLDQGLRRWNPELKPRLWDWFCEFVDSSSQYKSESFYKLKQNSKPWLFKEPIETLCGMLRARFPDNKDWYFYIKSLLFHFKGWSGMVYLFETKPNLFPLKKRTISLVDWLAILVTVESKINPSTLFLDSEQRRHRDTEINGQLSLIKIKEAVYYKSVLKQLNHHLQELKQKGQPGLKTPEKPSAQIFFCIDDREESFRRVLENINPRIETFGTVGFFGVDVAIKSADQLIFQPFCPPVIQPRKKAVEKVKSVSNGLLRGIRNWIAIFNHTRFTLFEPLIAILAPVFYLWSLLLRSSHVGIYHKLKQKVLSYPSKESGYEYDFIPGASYSIAEKATIVSDILKSAGLKDQFAPLIVMMAHGASTTNNPFQKSYGCGACSGQSGFPNAKIFCSFANDPMVRQALKTSGYTIPDDTLFIASHHDTCSDQVHIAPAQKVLSSEQATTLRQLQLDLTKALKQNTEIRFKRFGISLNESPEHRALDWSQPRPEYGHSNVALAIFGPRTLTEGLDLDRRAFLVSYDPATDTDGSELEYVIMNALPVCANINLDYFTSRAFPEAFGSGSKLPMNIVSGIGLMTGSKSDLKIGLARQMVDQHEALRLLSFVFCKKDHLQNVVAKSARLTNLIKNEWIHLIRIDPTDFSMEPMTKEITNVFH
ncbi:MAG: putative inorganic carbon transporter subunit DabA [Pseudobdellovibrionaceae bacterium]